MRLGTVNLHSPKLSLGTLPATVINIMPILFTIINAFVEKGGTHECTFFTLVTLSCHAKLTLKYLLDTSMLVATK